MCYSVEVEKERRRLMERFSVDVLLEQETWYENLKQCAADPQFVKRALALSRAPSSPFFKEPAADVVVWENGKRVFKKMRYRVRPAGSAEEIPTKYNVFNARSDSLEARATWRPLIGRRHGLLPFTRFFEWVERDGRKAQISFNPAGRDIMWVPCLFDYWENTADQFGFYSFALVTDEPPAEVAAMGHDRCPIFLAERHIDRWLRPEGMRKSELYAILREREDATFAHAWAA